MVHVAYMWRAGPWRDTCVVYGIDPRNDPKYRKYQSIFFQFEVDSKMKARDKNSHIFDGKILVKDGRCFQLCDITDPLLKSLIDREKLRDSCHVSVLVDNNYDLELTPIDSLKMGGTGQAPL